MKVMIEDIEYMPVLKSSDTGKKIKLHIAMKETRKARGHSLEAAGESMGVTGSYVWQIEHQEVNPSWEKITAILEYLNLKFEDVYFSKIDWKDTSKHKYKFKPAKRKDKAKS